MTNLKGNYRDIIKLSLPIYLGMLSNSIVGIIDTAFLGHVGLAEQSAGGYGTLLYLVLYVVGYGFSLGPQIIIARRMGEGKPHRVGALFRHSLLCLLIYGAFTGIGMVTLFKPFIIEITASETIGQLTAEYMQWRSFGVIGTMVNLAFMSYYIGTGRSFAITVASLVSGAVNVILDQWLIFGQAGFPEMGVAGASIASSIAELSGTVVYLLHSLLSPKSKIYRIYQRSPIMRNRIREIFRLALPLMLQNFISMGAWFIFFTILEKTGEQNFGISIIIRNIYSFFMIAAIAMGSATNSMVSNFLGQNRHHEVYQLLGRIILIILPFMALSASSMLIFRDLIFGIFTPDIWLASLAEPPLIMVYFAAVLFSISTILFNAVSGTGLIKVTFLIECITILLYLVYTYIISITLGGSLMAIWTSEIFYMCCLGIFSFLYLSTGNWKNTKL